MLKDGPGDEASAEIQCQGWSKDVYRSVTSHWCTLHPHAPPNKLPKIVSATAKILTLLKILQRRRTPSKIGTEVWKDMVGDTLQKI